MSPQLTPYRANKSCSLVAHILLRELSIPYTTVLLAFGPDGVEAADGSFSHADYRKINPSGLVPALRVEDEIITELPAILTYIAGLRPESKWFGKDNLERAKVYRWLCWLSGTLHGYGYGMILRPARFAEDPSIHPSIVASGRKIVTDCYERIERSLQGEHVVGDELTIVDINVFLFWDWGYRNKFDMAKHYPKYGRLFKAIEQRENVRAALGEEGSQLRFPSTLL